METPAQKPPGSRCPSQNRIAIAYRRARDASVRYRNYIAGEPEAAPDGLRDPPMFGHACAVGVGVGVAAAAAAPAELEPLLGEAETDGDVVLAA